MMNPNSVTDLHVALERYKIAVKGFETAPECSPWNGDKRQFNVYSTTPNNVD
jgi:hypothetical protein